MQAIILAGGKGKRLRPYTSMFPKPLMPIGEKPILEILVNQLRASGIKKLIFAVGYLNHMIESYFGDGKEFGVEITYSLENEPLGTAGPIGLMLDQLDENFLVLNGDLLTDIKFSSLVSDHLSSNASATIATFSRDVHIDFGVIYKNHQETLESYDEKPTISYEVSMGINVFRKKDIEKFIVPNSYLDIPDLMLNLKNNGKMVRCITQDCLWLDIGRIEDYSIAEEVYAKNKHKF